MNLEKDLGFDLYGRYAIIRDVIDSFRDSNPKMSVLDVGGRGNLLKQFLPFDDVTYLDPNIDTDDSNFIKADGCDMPLEDNSFDWVVSADVLEHVPYEKRNRFLDEQRRVSILGMIVVAPFDDAVVAQAELNINIRFRELFGIDHPWLIEHINNGLPQLSIVTDYAKRHNLNIQVFGNNEIHLWEMGINLRLQNEISKDFNIDQFTSLYNQNYTQELHQNNTYRKVVVLQKQSSKKLFVTNDERGFQLFKQKISNAVSSVYNRSIRNQQDTIVHFQKMQQNNVSIPDVYSQLYISSTGGFNEEQSMKIPIGLGPQFLCFDVVAFNNPSFFRFDPANTECSVSINNIELVYEDGFQYSVPDSSNSCLADQSVFYFNTADPNIFLHSDTTRQLTKVIIRCNYLNFEKATFNDIISLCNDKTKNNFIDLQDLNQLKKDLVREYFTIHSSTNDSRRFKSVETILSNYHKKTTNGIDLILDKQDKLSLEETARHNILFDELAHHNNALAQTVDTISEQTQSIVRQSYEIQNTLANRLSVIDTEIQVIDVKSADLKLQLANANDILSHFLNSTQSSFGDLLQGLKDINLESNKLEQRLSDSISNSIKATQDTILMHLYASDDRSEQILQVCHENETNIVSQLAEISRFNTQIMTEKNNELELLKQKQMSLLNDIRSNILLRSLLKKHL